MKQRHDQDTQHRFQIGVDVRHHCDYANGIFEVEDGRIFGETFDHIALAGGMHDARQFK